VIDLNLEDFWDNDFCGHLITQTDGRILRVKSTLNRSLATIEMHCAADCSATYLPPEDGSITTPISGHCDV
jgi:hypothetical protein